MGRNRLIWLSLGNATASSKSDPLKFGFRGRGRFARLPLPDHRLVGCRQATILAKLWEAVA